jgi:protein phosphatase methylesterase 1
MSNLYRSAIHARLSKLPQNLPPEDLEDGDEDEEEADTLGSLPSMPPPSTSSPKLTPASASASTKSPHLDGYKPISAVGYFDQALEVNVPSAQLNFRVYYTPPKAKGGTILICHHGAGYSALSFACFAKEVTGLSNGECGILAFDMRRHGTQARLFDHSAPGEFNAFTGKTVPAPEYRTQDVDADLGVTTLVNDCMSLLTSLFPDPTTGPSLLVRPLIWPCSCGCIDVRQS